MTLDINEAKNILKENMDELVKNPLVTVDEILVKANDIAIKSLEAWEKVKEEIESNMVSLDGLYSYQKSFHNNCNNVRKECIEIIDKHLSEVSE